MIFGVRYKQSYPVASFQGGNATNGTRNLYYVVILLCRAEKKLGRLLLAR